MSAEAPFLLAAVRRFLRPEARLTAASRCTITPDSSR
jgi:hypothetical protein